MKVKLDRSFTEKLPSVMGNLSNEGEERESSSASRDDLGFGISPNGFASGEEISIGREGLLIKEEAADRLTKEEVIETIETWCDLLGIKFEETENEESEEDDPIGYVYLAAVETGEHGTVYKIGYSQNPPDRIQTFDTKMPVKVKTLNYFPALDAPSAESELQSRYQDANVKGEWFDLDPYAVAKLKTASAYEDGDLLYDRDDAVDFAREALRALDRMENSTEKIARDYDRSALVSTMELAHQLGLDGLLDDLIEAVAQEKRFPALSEYCTWAVLQLPIDSPEEWSTSPENIASVAAFAYSVDPNLSKDKLEGLALALWGRCEAVGTDPVQMMKDQGDGSRSFLEALMALGLNHPEFTFPGERVAERRKNS